MVIDASALLAYFYKETGAEKVKTALERGAVVCAINLTEVYGRLVGSGTHPENVVQEDLRNLGQTLEVAAFDHELALEAGYFYARRKPYNLSLGDCACLALAESRALPVLTAEQSWARLPNLRVKVSLIR